MRFHSHLFSISLFVSATLLASCTTPSPSGFYWGRYPQTLYAYKKKPSPPTRMQHQNELMRLIDYANSHNTRVPPGVYAELGKLYLDQGDEPIAFNYFQKEQQLYPESRVLFTQIQQPKQSPKAVAIPESSKAGPAVTQPISRQSMSTQPSQPTSVKTPLTPPAKNYP